MGGGRGQSGERREARLRGGGKGRKRGKVWEPEEGKGWEGGAPGGLEKRVAKVQGTSKYRDVGRRETRKTGGGRNKMCGWKGEIKEECVGREDRRAEGGREVMGNGAGDREWQKRGKAGR